MPKIYIDLEGGLVQGCHSDVKDLEVIVIDRDYSEIMDEETKKEIADTEKLVVPRDFELKAGLVTQFISRLSPAHGFVRGPLDAHRKRRYVSERRFM